MSDIDPHSNFGTIECPSCAVRVKRNQNYCPICKYQFAHPSTKKNTAIIIAAIIMILLIILSAT